MIIIVGHYFYEEYLGNNQRNSRINLYNELNDFKVKVKNDILIELPKDKKDNVDLIKMKSDLKEHIKSII